jgi:hypothetical protein
MKEFRYAGSVSHGTMREEDLIPTFMDVLDDIREEITLSAGPWPVSSDPSRLDYRVKVVGGIDGRLGEIERRIDTDGYFDSEDAHWDLEYLFDQLDALAPAGYYFGAHPGDGSDYGFWEVESDDDDDN